VFYGVAKFKGYTWGKFDRRLMVQPLPQKFQNKISVAFEGSEGNRFVSSRQRGFQHKRLANPEPWERSIQVSITPMTALELNELLDFFKALGTEFIRLRLPSDPLTFPGDTYFIEGRISYSCAENPNNWVASFTIEKGRVA
jgi:hypothetical protein